MELDMTVVESAVNRPAHWIGGLRITCLLAGVETGGAYSMFEILTPPHDPGPPPHVHAREDEMFLVLEGQLTVIIEGQKTDATPGMCVFAPRNRWHAFRNDTDTPTRIIMIASPAGIEDFFVAAGVPVDPAERDQRHVPTEADIAKLMEQIPKFGMEAVEV